MDYCKITKFPHAVPAELDGVQLVNDNSYTFNGKRYPRYTLIPEVWAESFAAERERRDKRAQAWVDDVHNTIEAAAAGDEWARMRVSLWKVTGTKLPRDRTIKPSELGLPTKNFMTGEEQPSTFDFHKVSTCSVCGALMVVQDFSKKCCTVACEQKKKADRVKRYNSSRPKVEHTPVKCWHCDKEYTPTRSDSRFCGAACRVAHHRQEKRQIA